MERLASLRRGLVFLLLSLILTLTAPPVIAESAPIGVVLDGQPVVMEQPPVIIQGRTLVPLRSIMEALGAEVAWDGTTRTVTVLSEGRAIVLQVDSNRALVGDKAVTLDVPAQIVSDRLMVPVRFLVEATGGEVDWDSSGNRVILAVRDEELKGSLRAAKVNRELPSAPPSYQDHSSVRLRLTGQERGTLAVNGVLSLAGTVKGLSERDVIHVQIYKLGDRTRTTTLPISRNGQFAGTIFLDRGDGEYSVTLQPPTGPGSVYIFNAVTLSVRNVSSVPRQAVYYHRAYHQSGLKLDLPTDGRIVIDGPLPMMGQAAAALEGRFLWVTAEKDGEEWETYLAIQDGEVTGEVFLGGGPGPYWISVALQDKAGGKQYSYLAELQAVNTHPVPLQRSVAFLPTGLEADLKFDAVNSRVPDGVLKLSGSIRADTPGDDLWIVTQNGDQKDDQIRIPIKDGRFAGEIPLSFGAGDYTITVRTPSGGMWYYDAATLWVHNQAVQVVHGVRYTAKGLDKQIRVTEPSATIIETRARVQVAGTVGTDLGDHDYLIAVVRRDELEAQYRLPVVKGAFRGDIWLRFGPGEYKVDLFAPETKIMSYQVASLTLTNRDPADLRNTAPSFGIEVEDPSIQALAKELAAGKQSMEAARAVFEWVARNISYDYGKFRSQRVDPDEGAVRTLKTRTGVCRDYAALAVALLRAAGMEAHVVIGKAGTGYLTTGHAWVEVKVGERWVEMDPTFASGVIVGITFEPRYDPSYFDPDPAFLAKTHRREGVQY